MKKRFRFFLGILLICGELLPAPGRAATDPPAKGALFPALTLPGPKNVEDRDYLGLSTAGPFKLTQLQVPLIIIEIFSMYCPICQKEAPLINELHQAIEKDPQLKGQIKLIGIGAGNTLFEVDFFKKKYQVPFPLLPDETFVLHKALGETRTPYFFVVKLNKGEAPRVIYSELGGIKRVESFLETIRQSAGLK
ncbi:MAG: TlpA family protein disulfide reductase [Deltaproteobacteria bacterium]|nr:TlpA family protein disulfide reductase [Deltaproteobacteria bacterium]